jgi:Mor family transcriptional regulator
MITADSILHDLETYTYQTVLASHAENIALACAGALFECLFLNFRKQYLYVPTSDKAALQDKYEAIWGDFNGRNYAELSIKYHLSVQHIYTIVGLMRKSAVRQRQADLFPLDDEAEARPLALVVLEDYLPHDLQRAGLSEPDAYAIAGKIADHLCQTYPGLSIRITESMRNRRQAGNADLFDEAI